MNKALTLICIILLATVVSACGNKDDEVRKQELEGIKAEQEKARTHTRTVNKLVPLTKEDLAKSSKRLNGTAKGEGQ